MSLSVRGAVYSSAGLRSSERAYERGLSRLSSGMRIQRAADDAAGLAISERMRAQLGGTAVASRNVHDGINMLQTAEGGMAAITSILQRVRDLAVQAASTGSTSASGREAAATEVRHLVEELDRTARATSFNGQRMLDGSRPGGYALQVGSDAGDSLTIDVADLRGEALSLTGVTATTTSITSTSTTTSWTTRTGPLPASYATRNGNRELSVVVGGAAPVALRLQNNKIYTSADYAALATDMQTRISAAGLDVSVALSSDSSGNPVLELTAGDPSLAVSVTGSAATALGFQAPDPSSTTSTITSLASVAGWPSLEELVADGSQDAITRSDEALSVVLSARASVGAMQNRLEHRLGVLAATQENVGAARSRIADADMALEWADVVRAQVLGQAGIALQAQASSGGQRVVQLLGSL